MVLANLVTGQEKKEMQTREPTSEHWRTLRGVSWELEADLCAPPCVKQVASGTLLYSPGSSTLCSVTT